MTKVLPFSDRRPRPATSQDAPSADSAAYALNSLPDTFEVLISVTEIMSILDEKQSDDSVKVASARTSQPSPRGGEVRDIPRAFGEPPMHHPLAFLFASDDVVSLIVESTGCSRDEAVDRLSGLLVEMHDLLVKDGIPHINDPRVPADFRRVWKRLIYPEVFAALSTEQMEFIAAFDR